VFKPSDKASDKASENKVRIKSVRINNQVFSNIPSNQIYPWRFIHEIPFLLQEKQKEQEMVSWLLGRCLPICVSSIICEYRERKVTAIRVVVQPQSIFATKKGWFIFRDTICLLECHGFGPHRLVEYRSKDNQFYTFGCTFSVYHHQEKTSFDDIPIVLQQEIFPVHSEKDVAMLGCVDWENEQNGVVMKVGRVQTFLSQKFCSPILNQG
jgi:hypothetical protein